MTREEVSAWLMANPSEAVEIVRGLKVAGPWEHGEVRKRLDGFDAVSIQPDEFSGRLEWFVFFDGEAQTGRYGTQKEARAAADAALRQAGWSLA